MAVGVPLIVPVEVSKEPEPEEEKLADEVIAAPEEVEEVGIAIEPEEEEVEEEVGVPTEEEALEFFFE